MRTTFAVASRKRRKRVLKRAKGYYGASSKRIRTSYNAVDKAKIHSFVGRKQKKRQYRALWNTRISIACKECNMRYSQFINLLKLLHIDLNRKMLSEIAVRDWSSFLKLVQFVKENKDDYNKILI